MHPKWDTCPLGAELRAPKASTLHVDREAKIRGFGTPSEGAGGGSCTACLERESAGGGGMQGGSPVLAGHISQPGATISGAKTSIR